MTAHDCPHPRRLHRNSLGTGKCKVLGCKCLFGPPAAERSARLEPVRRRTYKVNDRGEVTDYKPPERISQRERLERMLWERMNEAGLPQPQTEYRFAQSIGRQFRADGYLPPDLLIEVEGGIWAPDPGRHNRGSGFETDAEKYNLASILGFRVLRFTERMIKNGTAVDHIRRALESRVAPVQMTLPGGRIAHAS